MTNSFRGAQNQSTKFLKKEAKHKIVINNELCENYFTDSEAWITFNVGT